MITLWKALFLVSLCLAVAYLFYSHFKNLPK